MITDFSKKVEDKLISNQILNKIIKKLQKYSYKIKK